MIKKKLLSEALNTAYTNIPTATASTDGLLSSNLYINRLQTISLQSNIWWKVARFAMTWEAFYINGVDSNVSKGIINIYIFISSKLAPSYVSAKGTSSSYLTIKIDSSLNIYLSGQSGRAFNLEISSLHGRCLLPFTKVGAIPEDAIDLPVTVP